ncbi:MAG: lamin tail domain-containing protein [Myxococcales bacterium]|jgi:hypothetical protein|nr:lamin tail domain-containing protein [Myxococcales bacterium]
MKTHRWPSSLLPLLAAAIALSALACGDDENGGKDTSPIECTSDAHCAGNTANGKTRCDLTNKVCVTPTIEGDDECDSNDECDSGRCEDGVCATSKMVGCNARGQIPQDATQNEAVMVEVTFAAGVWSTAAACPWSCDAGFVLNVGRDGCEPAPTTCEEDLDCASELCVEGACATTKQADCLARSVDELSDLHATAQDTSAQVEWTFASASSGWTTSGNCPLTACASGYLLNASATACIEQVVVNVCDKDADCAANTNGKIVCEIETGASEGLCASPECVDSEDCAGNTESGKLYCDQNSHTCVASCASDTDCVHDAQKPMCDNSNGLASTWVCVAPECQSGACAGNGDYCKDMRWTECPQSDAGYACDVASAGTCQLTATQGCSPACGTGSFCNADEECEWIGAQVSTPSVRISQIYLGGQGATSPATFKNGFIELYNYGSQTVSLTSLKLLIATNAGLFSKVDLDFTTACAALQSPQSCNLAPGNYFRLKNTNNPAASAGATVTATLSFSTNIGQNGTVAIATSLPAGATCHSVKANAVDLVGIGNSLCAEGRSISGISTGDDASRAQNAYLRKQAGQTDTADNFADFTVETPVLH